MPVVCRAGETCRGTGSALTDLTPAEPVEEKPAAAEELEADAAPLANDGMSGSCGADGNNVTWTLTVNSDDSSNPTYTLTISGTGDMADYGTQDTPWYSKRQSITRVNLPDGLTRIGKSAFYRLLLPILQFPTRSLRLARMLSGTAIQSKQRFLPV